MFALLSQLEPQAEHSAATVHILVSFVASDVTDLQVVLQQGLKLV